MSDKTNGRIAMTEKMDFRKIRKERTVTIYIEALQREITLVAIPQHVVVQLFRDKDEYAAEKELAWSIVDPVTLNPIYDPNNMDDIANLAELTFDIASPLREAFNKLNVLDKKAVEQTEKNSETSPISGSAIA